MVQLNTPATAPPNVLGVDNITRDNLDFIIHHVFLPPKLPECAEESLEEKNCFLLQLLHRASCLYESKLTPSSDIWRAAVKMLDQFHKIEAMGPRSAQGFKTAVELMSENDAIGIHLATENAGLVLHRTKDYVRFTSFEASPYEKDVNSTAGKLLISYPGPAVDVPWERVRDRGFLASLANFVGGIKQGYVVRTGLVFEVLTGILRAVGQTVEVNRFTKRIGDEIMWSTKAPWTKTPWRRSPLWLVARVALQLLLGENEYKYFMVFFMSQVLDLATRLPAEGDRLFVMNAKLARRMYKLQDRVPKFVLDEVGAVGDRTYALIEAGWLKAQGRARRLKQEVSGFDFYKDSRITMSESREYVIGLKDANLELARPIFAPSEAERINTMAMELPGISKEVFPGGTEDVMLIDFETWVMNTLDKWRLSIIDRVKACGDLWECMVIYMEVAAKEYRGDPERNSIMILTTMELWVVLDRMATQSHPLLLEYSSEFNESFLSVLLLPQAQQRDRLSHIEAYIKARRSVALPTNPSVFSGSVTNADFSVRYFNSLPTLQHLRSKIHEEAVAAPSDSIDELNKKRRSYDVLLNRISNHSCSCKGGSWWVCRDCKKCVAVQKARDIHTSIHKRNLPDDTIMQAAVVFELECPEPFAIWREATFQILTNLCSHNTSRWKGWVYGERPYSTLYKHSGLRNHFRPGRAARTDAGTCIDICDNRKFWLGFYNGPEIEEEPKVDIRHLCTFTLPDGPYKNLQYTLGGTSHTANEVLARQYECPTEVQIHEYIAFGLLRSGRHLQWLNMLRELRNRTLTFSAEAVSILYLQAAWQVGPAGAKPYERLCHTEVGEVDFGREMLREVSAMLKGIEANWQEVAAMQTIIVLGGQILVGTRTIAVKEEAVGFLREARRVCLSWVKKLVGELQECTPEDTRNVQLGMVQAAATCRMTFNFEEPYLQDVLHTDEDVAVLVECATIIHDNAVDMLPKAVQAVLIRDTRMAYGIERHLRSLITGSSRGIDLKTIWSAYNQGERWMVMEGQNERWVYTDTKEGIGSKSLRVHYNLISGELLAGQRLGRMPIEYTSHETYVELFGQKILDIFPSSMLGMVFQTKHPISGYKVAFALHNNELIIRTEREEDGLMYQLIPRSKLSSDFPINITSSHVFWLQLPATKITSSLECNNGRIDIRNRETPWTPKDNWYISDSYDPSKTHFSLGPQCLLLDIRSATTTMVTTLLAPLEDVGFIDVTYKNSVVSAHLPRLNLDFSINKSDKLECKQFQGMVVDRDQGIGTFIGLENLLVVRQGPTRSIIVPHGKVIFKNQDSHTKVEINRTGMDKVKYHIYTVNTILGTLTGNGSLTSHLYKIYLHAVTSHCHPDPLTRITGTEEALVGLRAAATRSIQILDRSGVDAGLFRLIAGLTPTRKYTEGEVRMQCVVWQSGLSPIAQHEEFYKGVKEVSDYTELLSIFGNVDTLDELPNPWGGSEGSLATSHDSLESRVAIRNSVFRTEQSGGSVGNIKDKDYEGRDILRRSTDEPEVFYVAGLVDRWPGRLNVHSELLHVLEGLGDIKGPQPVGGALRWDWGCPHSWLDQGLGAVWMDLYNGLRGDIQRTKYDWMFLLGTFTHSKVNLKLIETLLAFGTEGEFKQIEPPNHPSYNLRHGYQPSTDLLTATIRSLIRYNGSDERSHVEAAAIAKEVSPLWPACPTLKYLNSQCRGYSALDVLEVVEELFRSWTRNLDFKNYIERVQLVLGRLNANQKPVLAPYRFEPCKHSQSLSQRTIRFSDLLTHPPPILPAHPGMRAQNLIAQESNSDPEPTDDSLETLLRDFRGQCPNNFRDTYCQGLKESMIALQAQTSPPGTVKITGLESRLKSLRIVYENYMWAVFRVIRVRLMPHRLRCSSMVFKAGLWPRISPALLLQQLASNSAVHLSPEWKQVIIAYGIAITMVQRVHRLLYLLPPPGNTTDISPYFIQELENTGHQNWDYFQQTDWLLIEIESNLMIRPVQADIASSMMAPPDNQNSIMQLCMGEGKTSVIIPMVATSLADGKKLVRVVALKSLSGQMFQTLVQKLGNLVNRRVLFTPFWRGIPMGVGEITGVRKLYNDLMDSGGILLVQPEHILSFKLLGLDWLYKSDSPTNDTTQYEVARLLLDMQRWLESNSRDLLDECDELLSTKQELIYTIGNQAPVAHHPSRWLIIQEIFDLIQSYFKELEPSEQDFEVETYEQTRRFGLVRILSIEAGRNLLHDITGMIIEDQLPTVSFRLFPADQRKLAARFISDTSMTGQEATPLLNYTSENGIPSASLYLLRGLIAHNIILYWLKEKRWKVDYGLDLNRTLLAVPYRAKDSPAEKAEFSQPDVAITLTCLSYYYGGLNESQLEMCFKTLYSSDNPDVEYERWIKGVALPVQYLERLNGINLEATHQWKEVIYPTFKYNKVIIDFYLSIVVFPREAKEFSKKLSASGWDIAEPKVHPTTGFSGTNDNRYLLPLSINQLDTKQVHANAEVLSYILQKENSYMCIAGPNNERIRVEQLLEILVSHLDEPQVKVLLDAGAQVLELSNYEVAKRWLELAPERSAQAAVYLNHDDELTVLTRDGNIELLVLSAFANRLGSCLVYLDEAHTRGTDLKLPIKSRAAVTLGPNLTKDRLVQACMRMRKLGKGQSVIFCGPPEIDKKLLKIAQIHNRETIQVRDVLYWCMEETCINARRLLPIWAKQGFSYQKRHQAWKEIVSGGVFPDDLLEEESKTLQNHYGPQKYSDETLGSYRKPGTEDYGLSQILQKCKDFGVNSFQGARLLEEQEREVSHEVEYEKEIWRPLRVEPADHHLSNAVKAFVTTGTLPLAYYDQIVPAFSLLCGTSAEEHWERTTFSPGLLATSDFCTVVKDECLKGHTTDDFLRPVSWIVSSTVNHNIIVIMSSFEANILLPVIRESSHVTLHTYSPRVTRSMPSYELLDFYPIPRLPYPWRSKISLIDQLNIFAGQLYFRDYKTYKRVCGFLGLDLGGSLSESVTETVIETVTETVTEPVTETVAKTVTPRQIYFRDYKAYTRVGRYLGLSIDESPSETVAAVPSGSPAKELGSPTKELGSPAKELDQQALGAKYASPFVMSPITLLSMLTGFRRKGQSYTTTHMGRVLNGRLLTEEDFK